MRERTVEVNGHQCRVWEAGDGKPVGYLAGPIGLSRPTPFLEELSAHRRVIVPSLPGYPGGEGQELLVDLADWLAATLDLIEAAELDGADFIGASVGGALIAEVAAMSTRSVDKLALLAPFGLRDEADPPPNFFASNPKKLASLLCADRSHAEAQLACPDGHDEIEWSIVTTRALATGARLFWPLSDLGLARRIHRIVAPTLIVWGQDDQVIPVSYADRFAAAISAPTETLLIPGAGHLVDLDQPDKVAAAVLEFFDRP